MPKYDFGKINHIDFERMCQSLIQSIFGFGTLVFGAGKDGAREATFTGKAPYPSKLENWEGDWIFQVKYHDLSLLNIEKARRKIIEDVDIELKKVVAKYKHSCDNFILFTNVPLSPVFSSGTRDIINKNIIPQYKDIIKNISIIGADEICGFLDSNPNIRKTYREFITSGDILDQLIQGHTSNEEHLADIVKSYCYNMLQKDEKYAVLDDAGDSEDKRVELQNVFIDLNVIQNLERNKKIESMRNFTEDTSVEDNKIKSALSYLLDDDSKDIVLVGGPGEGKSTLTQYISQIHRARITLQFKEFFKNNNKEYIQEIEKARIRIPFRIILKDFAQWFAENSDSNIAKYLAYKIKSITDQEINVDNVRSILKNNPILILLDGLDEIPEKKLKENVISSIIISIRELRDLYNADIKVVATTRPFGYTDDFDSKYFLHLNVLKLSTEQAKNYCSKWLVAKRYDIEETQRIKEKFEICLDDPVIKVLTTTPLEITIVLVIIRARGILPKQREELFETYIDTIYEREQKKNINLLRTQKELILGLHKYVAYILQKKVETDKTASLMAELEFKNYVKLFVTNQSVMLSTKEIELLVEQIIKESEERLILITNNPKGKIGFPLTSMREFLAAAHLVDTAKNTEERDMRFKSIALSTHWRNVTLFFAGRVGRIRPGEISSMIDVCRSDIDLLFPDNLLKRGAGLVIDMLEDRAIRVQRNEVSAIQYGMTILDGGLIVDRSNFIDQVKNFPENAKNKIIQPFLIELLNKYDNVNLEVVWDLYTELFGIDVFFQEIIKKTLIINNIDLLQLSIKYAFEFQCSHSLIIDAWENLCKLNENYIGLNIPLMHFRKLVSFLDYDLSHELLVSISITTIREHHMTLLTGLDITKVNEVLEIAQDCNNFNSNRIYLVSFLKLFLLVCRQDKEFHEVIDKHYFNQIQFYAPFYLKPDIKKLIDQDKVLYQNFLSIFDEKNDLFTLSLKQSFSILIDITTKKNLHDIKSINFPEDLQRVGDLLFSFGIYELEYIPEIMKKWLFNENDYQNMLSKLNEITNCSEEMKFKIPLWINSKFNNIVESSISPEIIIELKAYLNSIDTSIEILHLINAIFLFDVARNYVQYSFELMNEIVKDANSKKSIVDIYWVIRIHVENLNDNEKNELINLFNNVLNIFNREDLKDNRLQYFLNWLTQVVLSYDGIITEEHIEKLLNINLNTSLSATSINMINSFKVYENLAKYVDSNNKKISKFATWMYANYYEKSSNNRKLIKNRRFDLDDISLRIWNLQKDGVRSIDIIKTLSKFNVIWSKLNSYFLIALLEDQKEDREIWLSIIKESEYTGEYEQKALIKFLKTILYGDYNIVYKNEAKQRLYHVFLETDSVNMPEEALNLPLPI